MQENIRNVVRELQRELWRIEAMMRDADARKDMITDSTCGFKKFAQKLMPLRMFLTCSDSTGIKNQCGAT